MLKARTGKARFDIKSFNKDIMRSSRALHKSYVYPIVLEAFTAEKERFLKEYEENPITQQMYAGADNPGINYPGGPLKGIGNLFAFLGFPDGSDPAEDLRNLLDNYIRLQRNYKVQKSPRGIIYTHIAQAPSKDEIFAATPMSWTSRSWIKAIENGVGGYQLYLRGYRTVSRSSGGFLSKNSPVRSGSFKNTSYFTKMYNKFITRLTRGNIRG